MSHVKHLFMSCLLALAAIGLQAAQPLPEKYAELPGGHPVTPEEVAALFGRQATTPMSAVAMQAKAEASSAADTQKNAVPFTISGKQPDMPSWQIRLLSHARHAKELLSGKMIQLKNWAKAHQTPLIAATTAIVAIATLYIMRTYCLSAGAAQISAANSGAIPLVMNEQALLDEAKKCAYPPVSCWTNVAHVYEPFDYFNSKYFYFSRKECMYNQRPRYNQCFEKLNNYLSTFSDFKKHKIFRGIVDDFSLAVAFFWKSYFIVTDRWQ